MEKTSSYTISLLLLLFLSVSQGYAQDTITYPLKIKVGIEASGPVSYFSDKNILNVEAYVLTDIDEKHSIYLGGGISNFKYSQINYDYKNTGFFIRTGIDFNLIAPERSLGKYSAGFGLHYGLSHYKSQVPFFNEVNYWGTTASSLPDVSSWAHFIEATPGVRAELFKYFSVGWNISLRLLVFSGTGKETRPLNIPGFGNGAKVFSPALNYFIVFNIPYKNIRVIKKKEVPEEPEEPETPQSGNVKQQSTGIRQQ
jgi:hypothetical protein